MTAAPHPVQVVPGRLLGNARGTTSPETVALHFRFDPLGPGNRLHPLDEKFLEVSLQL